MNSYWLNLPTDVQPFFLSLRSERKPSFLRLTLPLGAKACGGENLPIRLERNLAPGKKHVFAPGESMRWQKFAFPPGAKGRAGKILCFRPERKPFANLFFCKINYFT
jgi:hypothetical protein